MIKYKFTLLQANYDVFQGKIFDPSGIDMAIKLICNYYCGPARVFAPIASIKKFCQWKCPNSTVAQIHLETNQGTTASTTIFHTSESPTTGPTTTPTTSTTVSPTTLSTDSSLFTTDSSVPPTSSTV